MSRMQEPLVQFRFVTQQKQSFRVRIQSSDGINFFRKAEIRQRPLTGVFTRELRNYAEWFVKGD
jgi:hypothetical protein